MDFVPLIPSPLAGEGKDGGESRYCPPSPPPSPVKGEGVFIVFSLFADVVAVMANPLDLANDNSLKGNPCRKDRQNCRILKYKVFLFLSIAGRHGERS